MTRRFLRVTLVTLAFFLAVAGSVNLRQANAGLCEDLDCLHGGSDMCADIFFPNGDRLTCYGAE